jgi:glycosyltransferase involved in cell wall biosynthesis
MNVLCIYPGMTKSRNDNAFVLTKLREKGVKLAVITGKSLDLKGVGQLPAYEDMDGIPIFRLYRNPRTMFVYPQEKLANVLQIVNSLKPDIIFCSQELNIRLAMAIKRYINVPIVLLVEDGGRILSGDVKLGVFNRTFMPFFGLSNGPMFWQWLCQRVSAVITCHPRDKKLLKKLSQYGKPVYYLPWPTHLPDNCTFPSSREDRGVYVGSLYPFKNTQEFKKTLPRIIKETNTKQFIVVGPGPHAKIIKKLENQNPDSIKYVRELSRTDALSLIASSKYAYTPVVRGGWGFIGDCWSMKTPIVMSSNDGYVTDSENALVANNENALIDNINRLYNEPELFEKLQEKGYSESENRKAEIVSDGLYNILAKTIRDFYFKEPSNGLFAT